MQILNFVILSVIIAPHNVLTPHISKTHLPIVSVNVHELELNWSSKEQSRKKWGLPYVGNLNSPRKALIFIKQGSPLFMKECLFRMRFNLNIIFASNAWGEMILNELKRASMNLNQSK